MKDKDLKKQNPNGEPEAEPQAGPQAGTEETAEAAAEATAEPTDSTPEDEIGRLQAEIADWKDKNARLYADFDNFRKRTARERLELIKTASEDVVMSLLPVIDDFERALAVELFGPQAAATAASTVIEPDAAKGTAFEGVALIYHKLNKILTQNGVSVIDVLDQPFDEEWSEAVAQIPTPEGKTKGNVLDVVLKGYKIDNKVIRHAKVVVGI
ncbi:MAG: nucleotide exchange factor GrpE [Bacteroidales bacterium]|nr:nucleotide exchange factor GrpE [Bacteroidales bacterium]MDE6106390.1 nucleotide exchange factor GrpE [Bacteroidales bacterium]